MQRHAPSLAPAVLVGVGAAFDFHAGSKPRAPAWMQQAGLEWAHRLKSEPRRLAGRYVRDEQRVHGARRARAHSTSRSPMTASGGRSRFVATVREAFDEAGIEYVLLDEAESSGRDSDVDIAVPPEALAAVDVLVRSGRFGRVLQRLDYDVPSARYYVVESEEDGRRYRQIDVASDRWGIGRYGPAIPLALASSNRNGRPKGDPGPGARATYLAVKRARKHVAADARLRAAFDSEPAAARALLSDVRGCRIPVGERTRSRRARRIPRARRTR